MRSRERKEVHTHFRQEKLRTEKIDDISIYEGIIMDIKIMYRKHFKNDIFYAEYIFLCLLSNIQYIRLFQCLHSHYIASYD
jgi:hypothetical protein